jgi:hypothetical protein
MKTNFLAENYRRLFKGRPSSNDINLISEATTIDTALLNKLEVALTARISDPEDENAHDEVQDLLMQIYKKAGRNDAKELAAGNMEDEVTMTGPLSAVVSLIKDTMTTLKTSSKEIDILDAMGKDYAAFIKKSSSGSTINSRDYESSYSSTGENWWKYSYAGSPAELLKSLITAMAIERKGSKFYMVDRKPNLNSLTKVMDVNSKFKKIK